MIWVLVDFSFLCHRAYHAMRGLSHNDIATGVLYGFFQELKTICFDPRICSNRVTLFLDSRQSFRKQLFPAYKQKRHEEKTPEEIHQAHELHKQMDLLEDALPTMGFPLYRQTGLESDDLIARTALDLTTNPITPIDDLRGVMVTADGDLYQCITEHVHWFDPGRNVWLDMEGLRAKKGIDAYHWGGVKALAGCHTDGVPGVPGIGEKTAIDYLNGNRVKSTKRQDAINSPEGLAIVVRNLELVCLPHNKTKHFDLKMPSYDIGAFVDFCKTNGVESYLEGPRWEEWQRFFRGKMVTWPQPRKRGTLL